MYVVKSDVGQKRTINEDYYLVKELDNDCEIYIVADGLGGYECGEVASRMCSETIYEYILKEYNGFKKSRNKNKYILNMLKNAVNYTNTKIYDLEKTDIKYKGMGTTVLVVFRYLDDIYYLSIGDSRIYYLDKDLSNITQVTLDDTYVNTLIKSNVITIEESINHPQKHILTKAIGVFKEIEFEINKLDKENGYMLLCTDGVTNMINEECILEIFKNNKFEEVAETIVNESNNNGGMDNITALVIKLNQKGDI